MSSETKSHGASIEEMLKEYLPKDKWEKVIEMLYGGILP